MKIGIPIDIKITLRDYDFNRQFAIRDVYDVLVELITNSDDSYHRLYKKQFRSEDGGPILVEICEQRKGLSSFIRIFDRAEGMTIQTMLEKFGNVGSRCSEEGDRGFMGRGAKDCTVLGNMIIESIKDEKYYKCELTTKPQFIPWEKGKSVNKEIREILNIGRGDGTVIRLEIAPQYKIPHINTIIRDLSWNYALRDILSEHSPTKLLIRNLNNPKMKPEKIVYYQPEGELVCDESFLVPGYPEAKARLIIWKAPEPLEDPSDRFRRSGLLIKGERAIHECSLLYSGLEKEPYANKYFGRLECDFIDRLLNEYDRRRENNETHPPENPSLLIDPNRQTGLRRDHTFTKALFQIPSEKLRQLIEKDKEKDKSTQKEIASKETQNRLDKLAKAASKFLAQQIEELEELTIDDKVDEDFFSKKGVLIFPTYLNIAIGQIRSLTFYINRSIFDKEGQEIMVISDDPAISILDVPFKLKLHPKRNDKLIGTFRIRGEALKEAVCLQTKSEGVPEAEAIVKVVENKIEEHEFDEALEFEHNFYRVKEGSSKTIRLFAKYPELVTQDTIINVVSSDSESVPIKGRCCMIPIQGSNYAHGEVVVQGRRLKGRAVEISASINGNKATTKVKVTQKEEEGVPIKFKIVSKNLGIYRAAWSTQEPNLLEISATHDSIKRYLSPEPDYAGQEKPQFRVLLAEIIAESVCRKALTLEVKAKPWDFKDQFAGNPELVADAVLSHLQRRIRDFVGIAHSIMLGESEIE
jgi:predicted DNA-binding protein